MHLSSCLNPQTITNPYTGERQVVPCGKCSACLNARSFRWTARLDQERYCWQYALFFTLTYAPEHLPVLKGNGVFYCNDARQCHPEKGTPVITYDDIKKHVNDKIDLEDNRKFVKCQRDQFDGVPFLSVIDVQRFIKRLRQNIKRKIAKNETTEDPKIRYAICGEYGARKTENYRPHYHGILFFNGEFKASIIQSTVSECWKFGYTNTSFVSSTNSSYVASYLNSYGALPAILRCRSIRPFLLTSKSPAMGTLAHCTKSMQEMFFKASPEMVIFDHKKSAFDNVPLWRCYIDRLYPKISAFSKFDARNLYTLYGAYNKFYEKHEDYDVDFPHFLLFWQRYCEKYDGSTWARYDLYLHKTKGDYLNKMIRFYRISSRVCFQSYSFGISVRQYVDTILKFYDNVERLKLHNQFSYEQEYTKEHSCSDILQIDRLFLQGLLDQSLCDCSYEELELLKSYGVDIEKFFSENETIRAQYQSTLLPENTYDYKVFASDNEVIMNRLTKTKKKNEYIGSPEDIRENIIYGDVFADF